MSEKHLYDVPQSDKPDNPAHQAAFVRCMANGSPYYGGTVTFSQGELARIAEEAEKRKPKALTVSVKADLTELTRMHDEAKSLEATLTRVNDLLDRAAAPRAAQS